MLPLQLEDLKQFRQWGSKTPGHPENFETLGIEVTTGKFSTHLGLPVLKHEAGALLPWQLKLFSCMWRTLISICPLRIVACKDHGLSLRFCRQAGGDLCIALA
jgi:hypothetical protein